MTALIARLACSLAVAAGLAAAPEAHAQAANAGKPMHIVVTFTPGGAPDILARLIGEKLSVAWNQPVLIDNKPGAGGNTGADSVAKAPPDGLTIVVGTVGTHAINGALYAKMPYDMVKDFAPVTLLATTPNLLVINNDVPAKTLAEFIALGKREGKMTFASSGSGTSIHVSGELFKTMTGIDMTHVPYKGRATAIPDLLGGRVTMMFDNMPSSLPLVKGGQAARARRDEPEALAGRARDPDDRRAGAGRLRRGVVVRAVRAGGNAEAVRRPPAGRGQEDPGLARHRQEAGRSRPRRGRLDRRRARRLPARRDRQVGAGRQGLGRQGRVKTAPLGAVVGRG